MWEMWTRIYSKKFENLKRESVWHVWTDVNNWPMWHSGLDYCKLMGQFENGGSLMCKPRGTKVVKVTLYDIKHGYSFTNCTAFFGAKMYDTHTMTELPEGGLRLTNTLVVVGPLKWLWSKIVAQNLADAAPREMESMVKLARSIQSQ